MQCFANFSLVVQVSIVSFCHERGQPLQFEAQSFDEHLSVSHVHERLTIENRKACDSISRQKRLKQEVDDKSLGGVKIDEWDYDRVRNCAVAGLDGLVKTERQRPENAENVQNEEEADRLCYVLEASQHGFTVILKFFVFVVISFDQLPQNHVRLGVQEREENSNHRLTCDGQRHRRLDQQHQACILIEDFQARAAGDYENHKAEEVESTIAARPLEPIAAEVISEFSHFLDQLCKKKFSERSSTSTLIYLEAFPTAFPCWSCVNP